MPVKLGEYTVRVGKKDIKFYPLKPGTTVATATPPTVVAPNNPDTNNTITPQQQFGIFDIAIEFSELLEESAIPAVDSIDRLQTTVTGLPQYDKMPVTIDDANVGNPAHRIVNISFAVPIDAGKTEFEGTLKLTARKKGAGSDKALTLPIKVESMKRAADMFIFFIVHSKPPQTYCWIKLPITEWTSSTTAPPQPVTSAAVSVKVLRENTTNDNTGYNNINRRTWLVCDTEGNIAYANIGGLRPVLGLPIGWPIIFNALKQNFVRRGHMIKLKKGNIKNNLEPFKPVAPFRMMSIRDADMSEKKVMLDPGHAVVYAYKDARRSEEWFVAHRISERIAELLKSRHRLKPENLFWTRTAGFGLIEPGRVRSASAADDGADKYGYDYANKKFKIKQGNLSLVDLSDVLLTAHEEDGTAIAVTEAERNGLISVNAAAVNAIITRINKSLESKGRRVQPNSVRWETTGNRYIYTIERTNPQPGQDPVIGTETFSITTSDWFEADDEMWTRLARRSVIWSIKNELGSSNGVYEDASVNRPKYPVAIRAALSRYNAPDYMVERIKRERDIIPENPPNSDFRGKESMGWSPLTRVRHMNAKDCDINLSIHENGAGGVGTAILVTENIWTPAQVKLAKLFLKNVDPFDQGVHWDGSIQLSGAGLLKPANNLRSKYVYFELEYIDAANPKDPSQYSYEAMLPDDFVDNVAEQIVAGVVEFLFDQQQEMDSVTCGYSKVRPHW